MSNTKEAFLRLLRHPLKFRAFLLMRLPAAYFSGVRLKEVDEEQAVATVPYKWFSQNPFRSTYFACLAMAAELSTGVLAMLHTHNRTPAISMLVVKLEAVYNKKATGISIFRCKDGAALKATIEKAIASGEAQSFTAMSEGTNEAGEKIADFYITWSFKAKK